MTAEQLLSLPKEGFEAINKMTDEELKNHIGDIIVTESELKDSSFIYKILEEAADDPDNPMAAAIKTKAKKQAKKKFSQAEKLALMDSEMDALMKELNL